MEGPDDRKAFRILNDRKIGPDWENNWELAVANGKKHIVDILRDEPTWMGVVDRDEWSEEMTASIQAELRGLFVLPRFCLENYLIDPDELWEALPVVQRDRIPGGLERLKGELLSEKEKWLRHGVLWTVINPLWSGLRALGFKEALLDVENTGNDRTIKAKLAEWHRFLNPEEIFESFKTRHQEVVQKDESEQLRLWIHGKLFYGSCVHPVLNNFLGQKSTEQRLKEIFQTRPLPSDLNLFWDRLS